MRSLRDGVLIWTGQKHLHQGLLFNFIYDSVTWKTLICLQSQLRIHNHRGSLCLQRQSVLAEGVCVYRDSLCLHRQTVYTEIISAYRDRLCLQRQSVHANENILPKTLEQNTNLTLIYHWRCCQYSKKSSSTSSNNEYNRMQ